MIKGLKNVWGGYKNSNNRAAGLEPVGLWASTGAEHLERRNYKDKCIFY